MAREPSTEAQRVTWAKTHSGRTWDDLADAIGCSHAALSLWGSGKTSLANAKVHLVVDFARQTGVNVAWLLTGDGPAISVYPKPAHPLVEQARQIVEERPALADTAYQLLQILGKTPPSGS